MEKLNVATPAGTQERRRIPMSVPVQKLEVPDMPGYHLHWFNGAADRIERALDAGYEFVDERDVRPRSVSLGLDSAASGNTDMGSRVSVVAGGLGDDGQAARMYLMKQKLEWYEADQKIAEARTDKVAQALTGGVTGGDTAADSRELNLRYVGSKTNSPDMFTKGAMARKNRPA